MQKLSPMKLRLIQICSLILFPVILTFAKHSTESYLYQQLDNSNGLSNSSVNTISQDSEGLLWIGTWDGLNMFDGTDFKVFNYSNIKSSDGIGNNVILDVKEGANNNIWINTIGGVSRIDKRSGKIYQYFYNNVHRRRISEKEFLIESDNQGQVYCYSKAAGLLKFTPATNNFIKIKLSAGPARITKMISDRSGFIWLLKDNGEIIVCKSTSRQLRLVHVFKHPREFDNIYNVNGSIAASSGKELFFFRAGFSWRKATVPSKGIKALISYNTHYIAVSENQELLVFDQNFRKSSFLNAELPKLSGQRITTLFVSKEHILWIGTDGNGMIRIYPKKNHFGLVSRAQGYDFNKPVRSFAEVDNSLWVGTKGKGIVRFDNFWQKNTPPEKHDFLNTGNGLNNNSVFAIKKGFYPYIFIGTDGRGISVYNLQKNKIINWDNIQGSSRLPAFSSVYAILQDRDSSLWLGTSGSGLIHVKIGTTNSGFLYIKKFRQYLSEKTEGLANDIIYALAVTDKNHLWIACRYGGLSVFNKETGKFKTFRSSGQENNLSNNDVLSLCSDRQKGLWIGTSFGLNFLSTTEAKKHIPKFKNFTMADGLPNNTIHAIAQAEDGDIWISTNKGLAKLKPASGIITTFNEPDGLQSNEFSDGAVLKSDKGHLLFGGIYGFNYFVPRDIKESESSGNLLVTQLQVGGKTINENLLQVLKPVSSTVSKYSVSREMNFFRLTLKSISFINPVKNHFTYKLEGLDKTWNYSGSGGYIAYNNILPGDYTLRIRWTGKNGTWTTPVPVFHLHVKQYFWLSYPAMILYLVVLLTGAYIFHLYRKNKIEMKYQLEMEYQLRQRDEKAHQQRLNFFTNIAHEIQTPLTLIMGSIEHFLNLRKSRDLEKSYFLTLIHQHSTRLAYLVQQLLEFRKAEAGFLKQTTHYVDISKMLTSLTALFKPEGEKNRQEYLVEIDDGIAGYIDKDKLEKILFNLLSNAFKYSSEGDKITFHAGYEPGKAVLKITVTNTGCKLQADDIGRLFNRFYTKDGTGQGRPGTGIGLAFAKELATLINADLGAELEEKEKIKFTLTLPIGNKSGTNENDEVVTSAPSFLYETLLKHNVQPAYSDISEENKASLIDKLQQGSKCSVLLVEDESELRFLLREVLKEQYVVYEAANGREAISFLKKSLPDLIISDIMMPDMDGLALCNEVKNTPATAQIPFIILSARGTEENKQEGYEVGADAYILKPFNLDYLKLRIRKLLDYHTKMQNLIKDQNIASQFTDAGINESDRSFLESILKVIEGKLDESDLNASVIEDELAISKMQLYRKLKSVAGMTPAEFIKRVRLKYASDMLLNSQFTVSEIIYKTGFNSKSYFFREFKKIYHCAPNDYRARQYESSAEDKVSQ